LLGCESEGLPAGLRARFRDRCLRIPQARGVVRSLNLSTAAAIAIAEFRRRTRARRRYDRAPMPASSHPSHPIVPLFPLPGLFLFPGTALPLHIFEPRYRQMVEDLLDTSGRLGARHGDAGPRERAARHAARPLHRRARRDRAPPAAGERPLRHLS
jgi:hypothetical protein